ncbi:MAG: DUF5602 domain-containing protein [Rhizobacter sp.]|nr:DUF5602 domain-containing protein [Bacteriovorax sp.]
MKVFLSVLLTLNLSTALAHEVTYWGKSVIVGNGYAKSYVKMDHANKPLEIGVAITEDGLVNLPQNEMEEYILPMPVETNVMPYKHITLDWNPHGHEPDGVYNTPHFDFHFYFITNEQRQAITCMGSDEAPCLQMPVSDNLVANYAPGPSGVPKMGWHWVDLLSPEFNGGIFTRTLIYGYYGGKPIFLEPMITLEFLQSKEKSCKEIRMPNVFPDSGYYPKNYEISFDQKLKVHTVVLKSFNTQE